LNYFDYFQDKVILVCGGTGTIGSEIVNQLLKWNPKTIRIFSNSENELWNANIRLKDSAEKLKLRFLLGDIRDYERVLRAVKGVDYIFNAAAIKHVSFSEYNPLEAVNVNIHGLENIIEGAFAHNVKKIVHISTDKAVSPSSVMGATKMLGERLCISRDYAKGPHQTTISCVRFGNVLGSRGSIIPLIKNQIKNNDFVTLTDEKMRRFFMSITDAVNLVLKAMTMAQGGEIFVLKMPVMNIQDLLEVLIEQFAPKFGKEPSDIKIKRIGSRIGEKLDEDLISMIEFNNCYENDDMFIIFPKEDGVYNHLKTKDLSHYRKVESSKKYFDSKEKVISKEEIKKILHKNKLN